jgi:hypothetical protein
LKTIGHARQAAKADSRREFFPPGKPKGPEIAQNPQKYADFSLSEEADSVSTVSSPT